MKGLKKVLILLTVLMMTVGVSYGAAACKDNGGNSSSKKTSTNLNDNDVPDPWGDQSGLA